MLGTGPQDPMRPPNQLLDCNAGSALPARTELAIAPQAVATPRVKPRFERCDLCAYLLGTAPALNLTAWAIASWAVASSSDAPSSQTTLRAK